MNDTDHQRATEAEGLDFERAEFQDEPEDLYCNSCKKTLYDTYYLVDDGPHCEQCRRDQELASSQGSGMERFFRALGLGSVAAVIGAGIYYAVLAITGYEVGLIAIIVGLMVGYGVKIGSRNRGGKVYQLLAVGLTYAAIVSTYIPIILQEFDEGYAAESIDGQALSEEAVSTEAEATLEAVDPEESLEETELTAEEAEAFESMDIEDMSAAEVMIGLLMFAIFVAAIPFLAGFDNLIGLLIIGFALWEAWKMNRVHVPVIEGPYSVGSPPVREQDIDSSI